MPGCGIDKCDNGMAKPCKPEEPEYTGSAEVTVEWPEVDPSDLIP